MQYIRTKRSGGLSEASVRRLIGKEADKPWQIPVGFVSRVRSAVPSAFLRGMRSELARFSGCILARSNHQSLGAAHSCRSRLLCKREPAVLYGDHEGLAAGVASSPARQNSM